MVTKMTRKTLIKLIETVFGCFILRSGLSSGLNFALSSGLDFASCSILALLLVSGVTALPVAAKAYIANRQEMTEQADLIVLGQIDKVRACNETGRPFNYSEEAQARVIKTIKGSCPPDIKILGGENFICARFHIESGKAILFLKKTEGGYRGANWHLSAMPVIKVKDEEMVHMADNAYDRSTDKTLKLNEAMKIIKEDLEKASLLAQSPPYIKTLFSAQAMYSSATGESGAMSKEYEAYRKLVEEKSKDSVGSTKYLNLLLAYGTAPAKLYAVSALARSEPTKAKDLLKEWRNSKETVQYLSGCKGTSESLGTIAEAFLAKGRYLDFELGQK